MDAVREVIINALAHQNYMADEATQVEIYPETVEIYNAGWFLDGQIPEEHLTGESKSSKSRNELIANTLFKSKDIEYFGTGMPRLKELCDAAGVAVEYRKESNGTRVVFHRTTPFAESLPNLAELLPNLAELPIWQQLTSNEQAIAEVLTPTNKIKTTDIAKALNLPERTVRYTLQKLVAKGVAEAHGSTRSRTYSLNSMLS